MDVKKRGQHSWRETHTATESRRFSFIINAHGRKQLTYVLYNENIFFFTLHIYFMACCLVHVCLHFSHPFYLSFLPSTALTAHRLYSPVSSAITEVCQAIFLWRMAPRSYFTFSFSFFFFLLFPGCHYLEDLFVLCFTVNLFFFQHCANS